MVTRQGRRIKGDAGCDVSAIFSLSANLPNSDSARQCWIAFNTQGNSSLSANWGSATHQELSLFSPKDDF